MRLKAAGGDSQVRVAQPLHKILIEPFGQLRSRRVRKRRSIAFAPVAAERKLRYNHKLAAALGNGSVHLALSIVEDPQFHNFIGKKVGIAFPVFPSDPKKNAKAGTDRPSDFHADGNTSF